MSVLHEELEQCSFHFFLWGLSPGEKDPRPLRIPLASDTANLKRGAMTIQSEAHRLWVYTAIEEHHIDEVPGLRKDGSQRVLVLGSHRA